jgi:hypothetical protein
MKSENLHRLYHETDGKGLIGCMLSIVFMGLAIFLAIVFGPPYYNNLNFESDVKTEVSRAAAHQFDTDTLVKDILALARRNEINIKRDSIAVERYSGKMHVTVSYSVMVDFLVAERNLDFEIDVETFVGSL